MIKREMSVGTLPSTGEMGHPAKAGNITIYNVTLRPSQKKNTCKYGSL